MNFIKLTDESGLTVYVNPAHIIMIETNDPTTSLLRLARPIFIDESEPEDTGSYIIAVEGVPEEIAALINGED